MKFKNVFPRKKKYSAIAQKGTPGGERSEDAPSKQHKSDEGGERRSLCLRQGCAVCAFSKGEVPAAPSAFESAGANPFTAPRVSFTALLNRRARAESDVTPHSEQHSSHVGAQRHGRRRDSSLQARAAYRYYAGGE